MVEIKQNIYVLVNAKKQTHLYVYIIVNNVKRITENVRVLVGKECMRDYKIIRT
jgi:hypothetical protein